MAIEQPHALVELYRRSFELSRQEHGRAHANTAEALTYLGTLAVFRGQPKQALEPLLAATAVLDAAKGMRNAEINSLAHASLGNARRALGSFDKAEQSLRRTAHVRVNSCRALFRLGDPSGALSVCRQGHADLAAAFGPEHAETQWAHAYLSDVLQALEGPGRQGPRTAAR